MKNHQLSIFVFLIISGISISCTPDKNKQVEVLVDKWSSQLTRDQKLDLLGGTGFESKGIDSLGIPPVKMADGPLGVRWEPSTAFPSGISLAATWDTSLAAQVASAMAKETLAKGRNMLLGPCVNLTRTPTGGRNFESYGEDPFLAGRLSVSWIKSLQNEGVAASLKHFAANNQEHNRMFIDARISERALRELYLPAFEMSVKEANPWTVMAAYNKLNGFHAAENDWLLNKVLKGEWNYDGMVVSDWGAVHSVEGTVNRGVDLEMPYGTYMNADSIMPLMTSGVVSDSVINEKVRRILRLAARSLVYKKYEKPDSMENLIRPHGDLARKIAREGMVLLKNEGNLLPLNKSEIKSIAVIGPNGAKAKTGGGGSSMVFPVYSVSPLDGIRMTAGPEITVEYAKGVPQYGDIDRIPDSWFSSLKNGVEQPGLHAEYFPNNSFSGNPVLIRTETNIFNDWGKEIPAPGIGNDLYSVRWTGLLTPDKSGDYRIDLQSDDGSRLYINDRLLIDNWGDHAADTKSAEIKLKAGKPVSIRVDYYETGGEAVCKLGIQLKDFSLIPEAVELAKQSDVVILCVGNSFSQESEGFDRKSWELPEGQVELVKSVVTANPNTIVVLTNGQPVEMASWIQPVPVVLESWFAGQETGNALADILFGAYNPSGKLPVSFPAKYSDNPSFPFYPGDSLSVTYGEDIFMGYRYYTSRNVKPLFPFGFGLSYTTFSYADLNVVKNASGEMTVTFSLTNSGPMEGKEISQVYVSPVNPGGERPLRELKGFAKTTLTPGETKKVTIQMKADALRYWHPDRGLWAMEEGPVNIQVAESSESVLLEKRMNE